jgi:DNA repair exonuclease SbcCD ATPase subunit
VKEICELSSCDISNCVKRHPIKCKYYRDYGQCKFDPCMFSHIRDDDGIDALKKEIETVVENISNLENNLKALDLKLLESESIVERLTNLETKLENANPPVNQNDDVQEIVEKLNRLEEKLENMENKETASTHNDEKNHKQKKNILERLQELERSNLEKDAQIVSLTNKLEKLEEEVKDTLKEANECLVGLVAESEENEHFDELTGFKCPDCDFVGKNMRGLKVHMTRKHLNKVS